MTVCQILTVISAVFTIRKGTPTFQAGNINTAINGVIKMAENKILFNDDFVSGHVQELLDLKIDRRIITYEQSSKVTEILGLVGNTIEQLTAKRNSVVKLLTDDRDDDAAWATISGVTHVIDGHIITLMRG